MISGLKILQRHVAAGAMHDSKEHHDAPKCHENTRKAIIKDITSWIRDDSKDSLILWISAPAGSGKSAILQTIAERFHASGGLAASFFFSRAAAQRRTETYLIATIASQLAMSIPSTKPFTCVRGCCKHSRDESSLLQWKQCLWCFLLT